MTLKTKHVKYYLQIILQKLTLQRLRDLCPSESLIGVMNHVSEKTQLKHQRTNLAGYF